MSNTQQPNGHYKQVYIGYGPRSDFTLENAKDKGDFNYNYDQMGSISTDIHKRKVSGTNKDTTFGVPYNGYGKQVIREAPQFSRVDECKTQLITIDKLNQADAVTKRNHVRLPKMTSDRGLLSPTKNQRESLQRGPGTHHHIGAIELKASKINPHVAGSFGKANRDTHFGMYGGLNQAIYQKCHF